MPPKVRELFSAQPLSVGRFHLREARAMRGSGSFCVCHRSPGMGPNRAQFDSVLLSVLSKPSRTVSP